MKISHLFNILFLLIGTVTIGCCVCERIRYDNYRFYEIKPKTDEHIQFLQLLDEQSDSINFLDGVNYVNVTSDVLVAPHKLPDFHEYLTKHQIPYKLIFNNLQEHLDTENDIDTDTDTDNLDSVLYLRRDVYDWTRYHTLDETYEWLKSLAKQYPNVVKVLKGGRTYEGREILGVKVSHNSGNKGIFIEAGIHAREWISPATITYILNQLLTSKDSQIRKLANNYDWYIFPHVNPDGYVYTHNKDRMWRKTRSPQGSCYGTDPNRNWNYHWNEVGSSSSPCTETYAGKSANSEIEIRTFTEFISTLKGKINIYLSFHSYSQLLLFPYGYSKTHAKNHNDLQKIGNVAAQALSKRYGTKYTVGNIYETIYPASGSSIDWVYGTQNVPLAYTYELRPKGGMNGFVLPAKQIVPTAEETLDSLIALVNEAEKLGY